MNKKGQALVEFIIILPIFIMLLLSIFDIGSIIYSKIVLESEMSEVIDNYHNNLSIEEIKSKLNFTKDYELTITTTNNTQEFKITKDIDIITPGLNLIFGNPYKLTLTRSTVL